MPGPLTDQAVGVPLAPDVNCTGGAHMPSDTFQPASTHQPITNGQAMVTEQCMHLIIFTEHLPSRWGDISVQTKKFSASRVLISGEIRVT